MKLENIKVAEKLKFEYDRFCRELEKYNGMLERSLRGNYVEINGEQAHFQDKYVKVLIKKEIGILEKMIKEIEMKINELD